jgi:hypothetical protein
MSSGVDDARSVDAAFIHESREVHDSRTERQRGVGNDVDVGLRGGSLSRRRRGSPW